jgi:hypothetical protein
VVLLLAQYQQGGEKHMRQYVAQMQLEVLWQRRFQKRSCLELHVESIEESASLEQGTQQLNNCIFRFF